MQLGVITTVAFMFFLYIPQGIMDPEEFADICIKGLKNMLFPLVMVVAAYSFASGAEQIGFMEYVIELAVQNVTPQMLPITIFFVLGITEFIMGLSWGMYVIAFQIAIPLALKMGVNPAIVIGAVTSAGVWGSHVCFYFGCDDFDIGCYRLR